LSRQPKDRKRYKSMLRKIRNKETLNVLQGVMPKHLDSSIEYNDSLGAVSPNSSFRSDEVDLKNSFLEKSEQKGDN
jgi:hypothetical protein